MNWEYIYTPSPPKPSYGNTFNRRERLLRIVAERTGLKGDALHAAHWRCIDLHYRGDPIKKRLEWKQTPKFLIYWKKLVGLVFSKTDGLYWAGTP